MQKFKKGDKVIFSHSPCKVVSKIRGVDAYKLNYKDDNTNLTFNALGKHMKRFKVRRK